MPKQSASPLGAVERHEFAALHDQLHAIGEKWTDSIGPGVADLLRESLPDLDDVTIGRVLLAYAKRYMVVSARNAAKANPAAGEVMHREWATVVATGLDLTKQEWSSDV